MSNSENQTSSVLIEEQDKTILDWLRQIRRRKYTGLLTAIVVWALAIIITFALPAIYRSTATILIEQQEIPKDLARSTITSFADQRLNVINQRVMTTSNLFKIINEFGLYKDLLDKKPREEVLEEIRAAIMMDIISADVIDPRSGRPTQATIAFNISFDHESPEMTQKVANEITNLFLNENIKQRTRNAQEATEFLREEADKLSQKMVQLDAELAEFKTGNIEKMPDMISMNLSMIDRAERQLQDLETRLSLLEDRKVYIQTQLLDMDPDSTLYSEEGEIIYSPKDRLKVLRVSLTRLRGMYTEDHPDVVRLLREIQALEDEHDVTVNNDALYESIALLQAKLLDLQAKYSPDHPDIVRTSKEIEALEDKLLEQDYQDADVKQASNDVTNPAYIQFTGQIDAIDTEVSMLQEIRQRTMRKLEGLEQRIMESPELERKYRSLSRDYASSQSKYLEITAKLNEAKIGESLELGNQSEKFTIIEPPLVPERPIRPNRALFLVLGLILALIVGFVAILTKEALDDALYDTKSVLHLTGMMPIATLPRVRNTEETSRAKKMRNLIIAAYLLAIITVIMLVHYLYMPLDVMYYKLLRSL
tara:strand:+ start:570 stop:2348 length:1779 start_codon:yes stop_codon:yes gene_type:complete